MVPENIYIIEFICLSSKRTWLTAELTSSKISCNYAASSNTYYYFIVTLTEQFFLMPLSPSQ